MKTIFLTIVIFILSIQISNAEWVQVTNGMGNRFIYSLAFDGNKIFAGSNTYGVYLSTNSGESWIQTPLNNKSIYSLASNGDYIFAGTTLTSDGVYLSSDAGISWTQSSLNNLGVFSFAVNGDKIFAGTSSNGVYLSTNNGTTWTQTSLNDRSVYSLAIKGNYIFAGAYFNGVYLSTNNGTTWTQTSLNDRTPYSLAIHENNIFAGTGYSGSSRGVFLSTDSSKTWMPTSLNDDDVLALATNGKNIFAGSAFGVWVSNDNGANWIQRNEGLGNHDVRTFCIIGNYIFAGTGGGGVYKRTLSELTAVTIISNEIPEKFLLLQNYPNPFNPTTKIKFSIPHSQYTILKVYDALGKELETLVSEHLSAGFYELNWNASNYPSGIYFYTLYTEKFSNTNKMLFLK